MKLKRIRVRDPDMKARVRNFTYFGIVGQLIYDCKKSKKPLLVKTIDRSYKQDGKIIPDLYTIKCFSKGKGKYRVVIDDKIVKYYQEVEEVREFKNNVYIPKPLKQTLDKFPVEWDFNSVYRGHEITEYKLRIYETYLTGMCDGKKIYFKARRYSASGLYWIGEATDDNTEYNVITKSSAQAGILKKFVEQRNEKLMNFVLENKTEFMKLLKA